MCSIPLECPVTDVCGEILTMTKESNAIIDTLYATGIIDEQLNYILGVLSYKLAQISSDAINTESTIQYFIEKVVTKMHDYRSLYTRMGGKEPSVIYEHDQPITMTTINKSIFYVEGSYDNGHGGPSLQQQQELIAITKLDSTKKTSSNTNTTVNHRRKPKYIAISTDDNDDIASQVALKNLQQKQKQQQQQQNQQTTPDHSEFMNQLEREKIVFIELMNEYNKIISGIDFNASLKDILEFRDRELLTVHASLQDHLNTISIYNPDTILKNLVSIIEQERTSLLDYTMNIIYRQTQCTEYFDRHYKKNISTANTNNNNNNNNSVNNTNDIRPITSMYVTFQ